MVCTLCGLPELLSATQSARRNRELAREGKFFSKKRARGTAIACSMATRGCMNASRRRSTEGTLMAVWSYVLSSDKDNIMFRMQRYGSQERQS